MDPAATSAKSGVHSSIPSLPSRASSTQHAAGNLRPWEVQWKEFNFIKKIGEGGFGMVSSVGSSEKTEEYSSLTLISV
jgi:hypothetical protein